MRAQLSNSLTRPVECDSKEIARVFLRAAGEGGDFANGGAIDKYADFQSRWTFPESKGKVYVFGVLATTNLAANKDRWMAADFAAFRYLFSEADQALWLMAAHWKFPEWTPIIGDPHAQRLELPSPSPVSTIPVEDLKAKFLTSLAKAAAKADANDTIVVVLCGHEEGTGKVIIGEPGAYQDLLSKTQVEIALQDVKVPRSRVFLISIACYSGQWRSPSWTLLAAADFEQTSATMSTSGSRGSVFTYALLGERADGHGWTAPHPVRKGDTSIWDSPVTANMHNPSVRLDEPRRSTQDLDTWIDSLRRTNGGTYNEANLVIDPAPDTPSQIPIRPFTAGFLERLQVVESSSPSESGENVVGPVRSDNLTFDFRSLSTEEKALLQELATAHNLVPHANVSIDVCVNEMARQVSTGVLLPEMDQRMLLECLRYRNRESRRAAAIAKQLGWKSAVLVDQWARGNGLDDMLRAESQGAAIATEFFFDPRVGARWWDPTTVSSNAHQRPYKTMGPGAWLADAWVRAGEPQVDSVVWENAVGIANMEVGY
ncbi:hypothetical protein MVEN_01871800 [Mycena venus]|uniref:Uncharacterized protein n=1 Tax=Mycena venus TaxID=2733690 RepID=A0A8H7CN36_9AGAR|nr:hypothetical protein MVEN_01871800 [Mycena venus]